MRVLLDENLPRKLKYRLEASETLTVPERGWSGVGNGELLRRTAEEFDVFLTMDRGLEHQQNVGSVSLSIILLSAPSNDYDDLLPLVPRLNKVLQRTEPGEVTEVTA